MDWHLTGGLDSKKKASYIDLIWDQYTILISQSPFGRKVKFKAEVSVDFLLQKEAMGSHNPSLSKELVGFTRLEFKTPENWEIWPHPSLTLGGEDQAHNAFCSAGKKKKPLPYICEADNQDPLVTKTKKGSEIKEAFKHVWCFVLQ